MDNCKTSMKLYTRTDWSGNPAEDGEYIAFGSYPCALVNDSALTEALGALAGELPEQQTRGEWVPYNYFIEGKLNTDFMWYRDIVHDGERYRGVYFSLYRPGCATSPATEENSAQNKNGYKLNTPYWFKYEPLIWHPLEQTDGKIRLLCAKVIDAQAYQNYIAQYSERYYITDSDNEFITDENGEKISPSNYKHSTVRAWLNNELFNTAFSDEEKAIISRETVDNSLDSTGYGSHGYTCEDTEDYIALLGGTEALGMKPRDRKRFPTDYALCQGAEAQAESGKAWYFLRSPGAAASYTVRTVNFDHNLDTNLSECTKGGICPLLWIRK